ncbi:MAG: hypothetical protein O2856_03325 [Planctomycetota bacterium]|nr:hypothetical protein [Planctomycetota bacterium]
MGIFREMWNDEAGVIMSAEAVVLGTVGVVGLTAGLSVAGKSVSAELLDMAFAIRSLDQSYEIPANKCCESYTAGSSFRQEPVEESLAILCDIVRKAEKAEHDEASKAERLEKQIQQTKAAERKKRKKSNNN